MGERGEREVNKTIEAWLRGYFVFRVNGKYFMRYNTAKAYRQTIEGNLYFEGLHVFKGWVGFFYRFDMTGRTE